MAMGMYVIVDVKTGKLYVGSSQDIEKRIRRHFNELKQGIHHCVPFQNLWNKGHTFVHFTFETETREEAYVLEQETILGQLGGSKLLNVGMGVRGGDNLTRNPNREDIIARIKKTLLARYEEMTPLERKLVWGKPGKLNGMFGKTHSAEARAIMSKVNLGNTYRKGFKASLETRAKMSEVAKQRVGEKNPFYGKRHSELTKKRLAEVNKGKLPTNIRPVSIDGAVYKSLAEAGRQLGIPVPTVLFRVKSPNKKFNGYKFATAMLND